MEFTDSVNTVKMFTLSIPNQRHINDPSAPHGEHSRAVWARLAHYFRPSYCFPSGNGAQSETRTPTRPNNHGPLWACVPTNWHCVTV